MMALLVRGHRRNIPKDKFSEFGDEAVQLIRLCVLLRFAILFHHIRGNQQMPKVELQAGEDSLEVVFPEGWLEQNQLTQADFANEAEWLAWSASSSAYVEDRVAQALQQGRLGTAWVLVAGRGAAHVAPVRLQGPGMGVVGQVAFQLLFTRSNNFLPSTGKQVSTRLSRLRSIQSALDR